MAAELLAILKDATSGGKEQESASTKGLSEGLYFFANASWPYCRV